MGINLIEYAEIWTTALDQQAVQVATSGWMEANSTQVQYIGGKKFRVPTIYTTGLGDYGRGTGTSNPGRYAKGATEIKYLDYELEIDRSSSFLWDRHDIDESGFVLTAPNVLGEFQRRHVIPEIDSFRYSRIAQRVMSQGASAYAVETLTPDNILERFLTSIREAQDVHGQPVTSMVAIMSFLTWNMLEMATGVAHMGIDPVTFTQGGLNFEVNSINGVPIIPVVSDRLKSAYILYEEPSALDTRGSGYEPAPGAQDINWIITPRNLPIAISKTDNLKIWTPESNILGDDWLLQYRKYHDLWIMENQLNQIILSMAA